MSGLYENDTSGGFMKKILGAVLAIIIASPAVWAGKTTIQTLPNGMQVILKENHASPLVSSVVVVKAGSKYENDQNNGFTHLLEHMLFNGTETRSREEFNEGIKDHGGYINAFTRQEMTGYLIVMPREFIEYGLDLQSDQLFHSILPAEEFPKERDIVVEEIKKDNDDTENAAQDYFNSVLFSGTPYARPVIGYESTIRNVTRDEVMKYYKEHYIPNNMTLLIIGDFETPQMLEWVNKYFGAVPSGVLPTLPEFKVAPQFSPEIKVKKYPTKTTYIQISFPAPKYDSPDYYAFDVLTQILNSGNSSPLEKALTAGDNSLANDVSASLDMQQEYTFLNISVKTDKPENVQAIVNATIEVLKGLTQRDYTAQDIKRVVVPNKVEEIRLEEKLHYYGIMKAPYLATAGYSFLEHYVDNLSAVTPAAVSSAASKYFVNPQYIASALEPAPEVE
jgi:zinc protease